jgi:hypothetical protein
LTIDEIMSAWLGLEAKWKAEGMPHLQKIMRKPQGVGAEMKALADGQTGIMMFIDIMEGKKRQKFKKFAKVDGITLKEGTAITLRCCEKYFGSGRVVHADSAFSSVETCRELQKRGLYFQGIVKTAHTQYPLSYLKSKKDEYGRGKANPRGGWILLQSSIDPGTFNAVPGNRIYALGWYDRVGKYLITSCGNTIPGTPSRRPRHKRVIIDGMYETELNYKEVQRPQMVEEFYSCFSAVDIHDHYRQGCLEMEREWKTHKWYHRIFTTVFGICIVDSFFGYRYEKNLNRTENIDNFSTFLGRLAFQLINNHFKLERRQRRRDDIDDTPIDEVILACSIQFLQYNFNIHKLLFFRIMDSVINQFH